MFVFNSVEILSEDLRRDTGTTVFILLTMPSKKIDAKVCLIYPQTIYFIMTLPFFCLCNLISVCFSFLTND